MEKFVDVLVQIDAEMYHQAEKISLDLGMTFADAVLLFAKESVRLGRFPFELTEEDWAFVRGLDVAERETPNAVTRKAIEDAEKGIGMSKLFSSVEELMEDLDKDD